MAQATGAVCINVREIRTRDYVMVRLINGATKAGVHTDKRKEADRNACRKTTLSDEDI